MARLETSIEDSHNAASVEFRLAETTKAPCTVAVGTPDFLARIEIEAEGASRMVRRTPSGFAIAWISMTAEEASGTIRIASDDPRGGEFAVLASAAREDQDPDETAQIRLLVDSSDFLAGLARNRGELERSVRLADRASRAGTGIGEPETGLRLAMDEKRDADAAHLDGFVVRSEVNRAAAERGLGRLAEAEALFSAVAPEVEAELARAADAQTEREWAALLCALEDSLGDLRWDLSGVRDAIPAYRRAEEVAPRSPRRDAVPIALCKLGSAYVEAGDVLEAQAIVERLLSVADVPGARPDTLASALWCSAFHLARRGDPEAARAQCERGLALDPSAQPRIALLGVLSEVCIGTGRYEEARFALDELEAAAERAGIRTHEIPTRIRRAGLALRLGDAAHAREYLEEALQLERDSGSRRYRVEILSDLALALVAEGDPGLAAADYEEVLSLCRESCDESREASVLVDLSALRERGGEHDDALRCVELAEGISDSIGDLFTATIARAARGEVRCSQGRFDEARKLADDAARILESMGAREEASNAQETLARIGFATGDASAVERSLAAAARLLDWNASSSLDRFASIGLRSRFAGGQPNVSNWSAIEQDLVAWKLAKEPGSEAERDLAALDGWRRAQLWKARVLLERMPAQSGRSGESRVDGLPLPEVQAGTAVLEYARGREHLYAFVAGPERVRLVDLGNGAEIESSARALVDGLAKATWTPRKFATASHALYERLLAPALAAADVGTSRIVVVPSADLSGLPFDALVVKLPSKSSDEVGFEDLDYLIDTYRIAYAPSSSVLARLQKAKARSAETRFLVFGDPVYRTEAVSQGVTGVPEGGSRSLIDLKRLPATREESREIAELLISKDTTATDKQRRELIELSRRRNASLSTRFYDLRLGSDARLDTLPANLSPYTNLHFAVHGLVDSHDARHSGLVLSWEPATEGLLSLEDLLSQRLDADLVVLSACDTATGPIASGEGVQSLANAFIEAGARSVVASLWRVSDSEAAEIMKSLYRAYLDEKLEPCEALRRAKLEFREARRPRGQGPHSASPGAHPGSWASFVYVGAMPGSSIAKKPATTR